MKVMRIIGLVPVPGIPDFESPHDGRFLKAYDPTWVYKPVLNDAGFALLIEKLETTDDKMEALKFEDAGAALALWQTVSPNAPARQDGRPNRPLTAFTIEVEDA